MSKECTCGDTGYHWLPDENQAEANCWQCYYKAEEMHYDEEMHNPAEDVRLDEEEILPW